MFVAVGRVSLSIPGAGSLKSKRQVVQKIVERVRARFNVSIAEVADNDLWQRATLGLAVVANSGAFAQECVDTVLHFIEELYLAPVLERSTEVIPLGGGLYGEDARTLAEAEGGEEGYDDDDPHET